MSYGMEYLELQTVTGKKQRVRGSVTVHILILVTITTVTCDSFAARTRDRRKTHTLSLFDASISLWSNPLPLAPCNSLIEQIYSLSAPAKVMGTNQESQPQIQREFDFWDYVACSRCHLSFNQDGGGHPPVPFWVTECGHVICNNHLSKS